MLWDREAWRAIVHGVAESDTMGQLNNKMLILFHSVENND